MSATLDPNWVLEMTLTSLTLYQNDRSTKHPHERRAASCMLNLNAALLT